MKILIITWGKLPMPPVLGGAVENLIDLFINDNEKTNKHNIEIYSVANANAQNESLKYKNCKFIYIDSDTFSFKFNRAIRGCLNKLPNFYVSNAFLHSVIIDLKKRGICNFYDAVIIENYPNYVIPLSKLFKNNLILHLHNDFLHKNSKCSQKVFDKCNRIFTISEFIKKRVRTISNEDKVFTLYNGINVDMFSNVLTITEREKKRSSYGIKKDDIVFLFSGRLVPEKGIRELIEVFIELCRKYENIKLLIVGSESFGANTENLFIKKIKELSSCQKDKVIFTGYIEYKKIPEIYNITDIGVIPSQCNEAFCLALIEELASGMPVIASNVGGIPEIVNEKCSIKINLGINFRDDLLKSMEFLIVNQDLRTEMGKEAIRQANIFNSKKYIDDLYFLLDEMEKKNGEKK